MKKLKGILVSNGYMRTPKFEEITQMYTQEAAARGIDFGVAYTSDIRYGIRAGDTYNSLLEQEGQVDFVLFLDKDVHLASNLEQMGVRVYNSSQVIAICDDKAKTFQVLSGYGIPMPDTIIAPLVYSGTYRPVDRVFVHEIGEQLGFPLVVKECFGSFGDQVYLVEDEEALWAKRQHLSEVPHLYQKFVASSRGRDVRINVVGGQVVAAMLRTSAYDFRANITNGGKMHAWEVPDAFAQLAIRVCEILGADFAGVDLMFGEEEEPILCEVNSNAHIKNILTCTGVNVAEAIITHIQKECER
ncbi:MAG: ATP-grasp domain-containing protein [Cellulosilyticaceae bacterium]